VLRASFVVFERDMAGLLVLGCVREDTERSRPGRFDGGTGALREDEVVTGEVIVGLVCVADIGCWGHFGGPGVDRCWTSALSARMDGVKIRTGA